MLLLLNTLLIIICIVITKVLKPDPSRTVRPVGPSAGGKTARLTLFGRFAGQPALGRF